MFIAIDMDKLKQINDTLGHQEGDLAITLLAQAIKQSIRKSDYAIRLGGDEFCIILVDSTPQIAAQLPERIENVCNISRRRKRSASLPVLRDERKRYVT